MLSSYRAAESGFCAFESIVLAADLGGVNEACSALRCALSIISSCFDLSLARIGTKSFGTGVKSLKFLENFTKSLNLTALSLDTRLR